MKIKFNQDVELQVIAGFDEEADEITEAFMETFRKGEVHEVDLVDEDGDISGSGRVSRAGTALCAGAPYDPQCPRP